jgi:hypothetical protein
VRLLVAVIMLLCHHFVLLVAFSFRTRYTYNYIT